MATLWVNFNFEVPFDVDDQEGLVSISVELADPRAAAKLAQTATDLLQRNIISFKSLNARNNLDFINSQMNAKTIELKKITVIAIINFILKPSNIS